MSSRGGSGCGRCGRGSRNRNRGDGSSAFKRGEIEFAWVSANRFRFVFRVWMRIDFAGTCYRRSDSASDLLEMAAMKRSEWVRRLVGLDIRK